MDGERQFASERIRAILIDIEGRSVSFETPSGGARLRLTDQGLLLEALAARALTPAAPPSPVTARAVDRLVRQPEGEPTVSLTGRLKSAPVEGRRDGKGKPTVWARFAAHVDGEDQPHLYSATFHRHTAAIAKSLPQEAAITVLGYVHPSGDPTGKRMDTLSVVNIISHSGAGSAPQPRERRGERGPRR